MTFINTPLYFAIPMFVLLGCILSFIFAFIPLFACGDMVVYGEVEAHKAENNLWWGITGVCFVGGWVLAFAIMSGWVE